MSWRSVNFATPPVLTQDSQGPRKVVSLSSLQPIAIPVHKAAITDPPFGDNFIYSEMANFFYAWMRIPLSRWYTEIAPVKVSPHAQEAVKNVAHHPDDADAFYQSMMTACWTEACRLLKPAGLMAFTFHHSEDSQWAIVLEALLDAGFYIEAIYPVTSDESKGENAEFGSKKIEYDMLHVCRKRLADPTAVSWAKMRQWVKTELGRLKLLLAPTRRTSSPMPTSVSFCAARRWSSTVATTGAS